MSAREWSKMVKSFRVISTSVVFLLLGWTVPAASQQEQQDKPKNEERQQQQAKPARQEQPQANRQQDQQRQQQQQTKGRQDQQRQQRRQQQANSARQQQQDKSAKQRQQAKGQQDQERQQQRQQHDNKSVQQRSSAQVRQQQVAWRGDRAQSWQSEHRTWQQRGGYNGYRVPDERFRRSYGQRHAFRIYNLPVMYVGGHRRFQYGGYWFGLVDPWPEYWSNDWYDSDDVYVDYYGDGYYLYNRRYPGDRIAISFYLN